MNEEGLKIVVAHPYKQHSFELAEALRRKGILHKYITTVYYKKANLTWILTMGLKGTTKGKALSRSDKRIDSFAKQYCEIWGLIKLLVLRKPKLMKYYNFIKYHSSDVFARKVARYCCKNHVDAVVVYDDTSPLCAEIIKKKDPNIKVIIDMSAPSLPYLSAIYRSDMELAPDFAEILAGERKNALNEKLLERSRREINSADYYLVASNFSVESITTLGKSKESVFVCPYGVDAQLFQPGSQRNGEVLKAVYVGGTKEFKGISYLLKAFEQLKDSLIELTIVGANTLPESMLEKYSYINFTGVIMHEEVAKVLQHSDFMIFPSIGDGFGLSVTEALASGCPVICSLNAGAVDLIEDGYNGFKISAQDVGAIVDKVRYFINNRESLKNMQINARESVKDLTWDKYYERVGCVFDTIFNE